MLKMLTLLCKKLITKLVKFFHPCSLQIKTKPHMFTPLSTKSVKQPYKLAFPL